MDKTPRIPIPWEVRQYIFSRDKYQCQSCGRTSTETQLSIDHIIPLAKGGSNDMSNLHTLCGVCNSRKSDKLDGRFRRYFSNS